MTALARPLRLARSIRLALPRGGSSRGVSTTGLFLAGLVATAAAMALTAIDAGGQAVLWENAHWTIAAAAAFLLAAVAASREQRSTRRRAMALGLGLYLLGQLVWDIQSFIGFYAVPAPSDLFFLPSGIPIAVAFLVAARSAIPAQDRKALLLDAAAVFMAIVTVVLLALGTGAPDTEPIVTFTTLAYPVAFLAVAGAMMIALLALRIRPALTGAWVVLGGFVLLGLSWLVWLELAVQEIPEAGNPVNYLFSCASLLLGIGAATWKGSERPDPAWDRFARWLLATLPIGAVVLSLGMLLLVAETATESTRDLVALAAIGTVLLALGRQTLLLRERERGYVSEREAAERERLAAERARTAEAEAQAALEAYHATEARYRDVVEVFTRLGEQMTLAPDEPSLLKSAAAALHRLAPSGRGDVLVVNASQDRLIVAASWGDQAPEVGSLVDVESPVRCLGIRRGSVYFVDDVTDDLQLPCPAHPTARGSTLCVPMVALGQVVGVIHLEREQANAFDRDSQRQATRVAEQVALAVSNGRLIRTMQNLAVTDPLTGLHNARFFDPFLDKELSQAQRDGRPMGIVMIDLDQFKHFNDTHGHPAGDEALRAFARAAVRTLRGTDTLARYGGEEFVLAVRNADLAATAVVAEKIRAAIEDLVIDIGPGRTARLHASFGVASTADHGSDRMTLLRSADAALYRAKQLGRNRVETARGLS